MADDLRITRMSGSDDDPAFGFVYSALRDSMRERCRDLSDADYYATVGREIADILHDSHTSVRVLSYNDNDCAGEYLGFIVLRHDVEVVYVYVKSVYRGNGLARHLLQDADVGIVRQALCRHILREMCHAGRRSVRRPYNGDRCEQVEK